MKNTKQELSKRKRDRAAVWKEIKTAVILEVIESSRCLKWKKMDLFSWGKKLGRRDQICRRTTDGIWSRTTPSPQCPVCEAVLCAQALSIMARSRPKRLLSILKCEKGTKRNTYSICRRNESTNSRVLERDGKWWITILLWKMEGRIHYREMLR